MVVEVKGMLKVMKRNSCENKEEKNRPKKYLNSDPAPLIIPEK